MEEEEEEEEKGTRGESRSPPQREDEVRDMAPAVMTLRRLAIAFDKRRRRRRRRPSVTKAPTVADTAVPMVTESTSTPALFAMALARNIFMLSVSPFDDDKPYIIMSPANVNDARDDAAVEVRRASLK